MYLKNNGSEKNKIRKRSNILFFIIILLFAILIINYFYIQIIQGDKNKELAYENTIRSSYIEPERGNILDRNREIIANNNIKFNLSIIPENIESFRGSRDNRISVLYNFLVEIENILNINLNKNTLINRIMNKPSFVSTDIITFEDYNEFALSYNKLKILSGIHMDTELVRNYPYSELFFHALGYTSLPKSEEINNQTISQNSIVGRTGLEHFYNNNLQGELGIKNFVIGATGRVISTRIENTAVSGDDIITSLDLETQRLIHEEFEGKKGAAIVVDVNTGEIIAYYSAPSPNPNSFTFARREEIENINNHSGSPLLNRLTQSTYPPASTIKPFIAFGAVLGDFIDPEETIFSEATYKVGNQEFREWMDWGHGEIDMARSLSRSSNYYYYDLGYEMGVDYIHDVLSIFNFGQSPDFMEVGEIKTGINPSNDWKMRIYGEPFYKGEEVMIAIGSGLISVSPIEMVYATKMIANGGKKYQLKFNLEEEINLLEDLNLSNEWLDPVRQGLYDTVNTSDGTARALRRYTDVISAGKTGTAQVFSSRDIEDFDNELLEEDLRNHSLFMGYAPYNEPEIAIFVIGENQGGGSGFATELAGKIIGVYLEDRRVEDYE